jgi:hypothetical protein
MDPDLIRIRVAGDQPCDYCADTLRAVVEDWSAAYPNSRIELFGRDNNVRRDESQAYILVAEPGLADQLQNLSVDNRHAPGPPAPSPYQNSFEAPVPTSGMPHHVSPVEFQHYLKFYTDNAQQYRLQDETAIDRAARTAAKRAASP